MMLARTFFFSIEIPLVSNFEIGSKKKKRNPIGKRLFKLPTYRTRKVAHANSAFLANDICRTSRLYHSFHNTKSISCMLL